MSQTKNADHGFLHLLKQYKQEARKVRGPQCSIFHWAYGQVNQQMGQFSHCRRSPGQKAPAIYLHTEAGRTERRKVSGGKVRSQSRGKPLQRSPIRRSQTQCPRGTPTEITLTGGGLNQEYGYVQKGVHPAVLECNSLQTVPQVRWEGQPSTQVEPWSLHRVSPVRSHIGFYAWTLLLKLFRKFQ